MQALERCGEFIVTPLVLVFSDFNFKGLNFWLIVLALSFLCMVLGIPVAGATLTLLVNALALFK